MIGGYAERGFRQNEQRFERLLTPAAIWVFIIHTDENILPSYTHPFARLLNESTLLQNSVRTGFVFDKLVRQLALPNYV